MKRRILTIVLAIVLAVIGTGAVLVYVNQADARAIAGQKAVTVLVATQQIPAGTLASTALSDGMLARQKFPAASVPSDAIRSLSPVLGSLVMSADVPSGELLLRPMLVTAVQATSGIAIPAGKLAVTIALCVPEAVAEYVHPGSQVAVFDTTVQSGTVSENCGSSSSSSAKVSTRIVLFRVTVLAIGVAQSSSQATSTAFAQSSSPSSNPQGSVLVTLALSQADAERVIDLAQAGLPYLALLTPSSVIGPDHGLVTLFPAFK